MGRKLMRVALDFDYPLNKKWVGYLNPFANQCIECPACAGTGYAPQARKFAEQWYGRAPFDPIAYGANPITVEHPALRALAERHCERDPVFYGKGELAIKSEIRRLFDLFRGQWSHQLIQADVDALLEAGRLYDFTRVPLNDEQREIVRQKMAAGGNSWLPENNGYRPTADEVNAWSMEGMGHDAINRSICVQARCIREGVGYTCDACTGHGQRWYSAAMEKAYDEWQRYDPPTGSGYQLWETTSEGSPVSPVFVTLEELCTWCAKNATVFGSQKVTAEEWRRMLDEDFVRHEEGNIVFT